MKQIRYACGDSLKRHIAVRHIAAKDRACFCLRAGAVKRVHEIMNLRVQPDTGNSAWERFPDHGRRSRI
jgi:hypothetical protein